MLFSQRIKLRKNIIQQLHRFVRRHLFGHMREVDDVCEHDGHIGVTIGNIGFLTFQADRDGLGQDVKQQALGKILFQ